MYLVTGGGGFIGSNIVAQLLADGQRVRVFDNFSNGLRTNLEPFGSDVEVVEGDVRDFDAVAGAMQGVERVLHLAALGSVPRSIDDPITSNAVNVDGTLNVLVAARDAGVRRLVFSSSSSVYGDNPALPKNEEHCTRPVSPYATSKLAGENYTRVFSRVYEIETVCLRYFNVFGPRQRPDAAYAAVIPLFMEWALEGRPLTIHGDGGQSRDFTFVDNIVQANLLASSVEGVGGEVFNVACGSRYSLLDIAAALEAAVGHPLERNHVPARPGDVRHSEADSSHAAEKMGYKVLVPFEEGLRRTWEAFLEKKKAS